MSGVLILSVSAGQLAGPSDEAGQQVAQALLAHGLPVASRQVVDEDEPAVGAALRAGVGAYGVIVVLGGAWCGGGGGAGGAIASPSRRSRSPSAMCTGAPVPPARSATPRRCGSARCRA